MTYPSVSEIEALCTASRLRSLERRCQERRWLRALDLLIGLFTLLVIFLAVVGVGTFFVFTILAAFR